MSEARPWSNTPSCMADGMAVVLVIGEGSEGIYQLPKELDVRFRNTGVWERKNWEISLNRAALKPVC